MRVILVFWWVCFIIIALLVQQQVPGVDALSAGVLVALQRGKRVEICWVIVLCILLQEGPGTLPFGMAPLWYAGHVVFFRLGGRVLVQQSVLFAVWLCVALSVYKAALLWFMYTLTDLPVDYAFLIEGSIKQLFITPVLWWVAYMSRPKEVRHAH